MALVNKDNRAEIAEIKNPVFYTPKDLFTYVVQNDIEKVKDVLRIDPDVVYNRNSGGSTALHLAMFHAHYEIARELIALGADPEAENNQGRTPLSYDKTQARLDILGKLKPNYKPKNKLLR